MLSDINNRAAVYVDSTRGARTVLELDTKQFCRARRLPSEHVHKEHKLLYESTLSVEIFIYYRDILSAI